MHLLLMSRKSTKAVAFCGVLTALATVIMLLAGVLPTASYTLAALAGITTALVVLEFGSGRAVACFAAISAVSLLLVANKEPVMLFICLLGWYPIAKAQFERIASRVLEWTVKTGVFAAAVAAFYFIYKWLFFTQAEFEGAFWAKYGLALTLLTALAAFVIYDIALSKLIMLYKYRFQQKVRNLIK